MKRKGTTIPTSTCLRFTKWLRRGKRLATVGLPFWGPKKLSDIGSCCPHIVTLVPFVHFILASLSRKNYERADLIDNCYWEFLSDPKLLNTAVTRARCLVAVVGDPVSLCTVGECRSIWRDYIKRCNDKKGLHGTTVDELDKEVNASIASIELNPKAQSFIPNVLPTQDKCSSVDVNEEKEAEGDKESVEETKREKNADEAQPSESHGKESNNPPKMSGEVTESSDQEDVPCVNTMDSVPGRR
ncbi:hypothetical protein OS493_023655 [Desmophyllum pertusum]|uniref:Uncharacterized protein n=1 Tax=Desmophyllum pertusum TaxID=174260 RepID=A0A9W9ZDW3_9CNID|nr:hypothetical protein OS493_023655 [Desmophyllum pertusum]